MKSTSCLSLLLAVCLLGMPAQARAQTGPSEREDETIDITPQAEQPVPRPSEKIVPGEALPGEEPEETAPGARETLSPAEKVRVDELDQEFLTRTDQEITMMEKNIEQEASVRDTGIKF